MSSEPTRRKQKRSPEARSTVFAHNLDQLIRLQGLSRKSAAEAADVRYKWLRRAVTKGIAKRSVKNAGHLDKLSSFFELPTVEDFWRTDLIRLEVAADQPLAASSFESARRQQCLSKVTALLSSEHAAQVYDFVDGLFDHAGLPLVQTRTTENKVHRALKHLIQWSGNKRRQASQIIRHFPPEIETYYEPFLGGGSVLRELLASDIWVRRYQCGDSYAPLIAIWNLIKHEPQRLCEECDRLWRKLAEEGGQLYRKVRTSFNETHDPCQLFFLLQTTRNGIFHFNKKNEFIGSFRTGRFGTKGALPSEITHLLGTWSEALVAKNVVFRCEDYSNVTTAQGDVMYLDPPFPGVSRTLYHAAPDLNELLSWLEGQKCHWLLSLGGYRGSEDRTISVPGHLYHEHLQIDNPDPFLKVNGKPPLSVTDSLYIHQAPPA